MARPTRPLVLVVDDEPAFVHLMQNLIASFGYEPAGAETGEEALLSAAKKTPALILLDIMMPGIDGLETLRRLKADEKTRPVPVLVISARQTGRDIEKAFELGAAGFVIKPVQAPILKKRLDELLGGERAAASGPSGA